MPDSESWRIVARVPRGKGEWRSSTPNVMSAWPSSVSAIFLTDPIDWPPVWTGLPLTIWAAFSKRAVTV